MIPRLEVCKVCKHLTTIHLHIREIEAYTCRLRREEKKDTSCVIAVGSEYHRVATIPEACPYLLEQVLYAEQTTLPTLPHKP